MNKTYLTPLLLSMPILLATRAASAHHSPNLHYDRSEIVAIVGEVTAIDWANPHSIIEIAGREERLDDSEWLIEAGPVAQITRRGMTRDAISVGDSVRAAGYRGRRNPNAIFLTNFLLADGREWLAWIEVEPIWTDRIVGDTAAYTAAAESVSDRGIFQVWSRDEASVSSDGLPRSLWNEDYPLTDTAREAQSSWDPIADNPYLSCQNGMPAIMDTGHPMEFLREGPHVILRFEELDVRRIIFMEELENLPTEPGPYGRSTGRWENDSLVVHTTAIDWPWFDQNGIPQSDDLTINERFTPSADGRFLHYHATVVDPAVFTDPVVLERRWVRAPGEVIKNYACRWDDAIL